MDAKLLMHVSHYPPPVGRRSYMPCIRSVMTKPTENVERLAISTKTEYKDNWFDTIAINHLSQSVQSTIGLLHGAITYNNDVYIHKQNYTEVYMCFMWVLCCCIRIQKRQEGIWRFSGSNNNGKAALQPEQTTWAGHSSSWQSFSKAYPLIGKFSLSSHISFQFSVFYFIGLVVIIDPY